MLELEQILVVINLRWSGINIQFAFYYLVILKAQGYVVLKRFRLTLVK